MTHEHRCACGTVIRCAAEPDKCAVFEPWDCPACLQTQRDEYFQHVAELRERLAVAKAELPLSEVRHAHRR
jgi:hypothetical protein